MTSDMGWSRHVDEEAKGNAEACYRAAKRAGHTDTEAEECEAGGLHCPECPWKEGAS